MKILLLVDDYLPHSIKVGAKMMHDLALEFQNNRHRVTVLTPKPSINKKFEIASLDGIKILFFRSGKLKNTGKIKRAVNESLLSFNAWRATRHYLKDNPCDAIVYYSPTIFWGPLVKYLKNSWKSRSYLILRDIFPQWTIDNGLMRMNSPVHIYFKFFERINYRHADRIGLMSPSNQEFFKSRKAIFSKSEVLFNWAHIDELTEPGNFYRRKLGLEKKTVLFYGGNIGHAQQMKNLINLAYRFKTNTSLHFLFVGTGDEVDLIRDEKEKHNLDNLTYLPPVDQDTYFEMLNEFDIGMFSLHPDHKTHNFPGKLLGYMAYSKPVLGCVNPGNDLMQIINDAGAGIITDSRDENELFKAATSLIDSETLRREMGENGRILLSKKFSVENAALQIENSIQSLK